MKREKLQGIVHWLFRNLSRLQFIRPEHVPLEGGVIVATNHLSRLDIPVLFLIPTRPDITALVTDKYKRYPFFRWFAESANGIWIDRTKSGFTAFREAADAAKGRLCRISRREPEAKAVSFWKASLVRLCWRSRRVFRSYRLARRN